MSCCVHVQFLLYYILQYFGNPAASLSEGHHSNGLADSRVHLIRREQRGYGWYFKRDFGQVPLVLIDNSSLFLL